MDLAVAMDLSTQWGSPIGCRHFKIVISFSQLALLMKPNSFSSWNFATTQDFKVGGKFHVSMEYLPVQFSESGRNSGGGRGGFRAGRLQAWCGGSPCRMPLTPRRWLPEPGVQSHRHTLFNPAITTDGERTYTGGETDSLNETAAASSGDSAAFNRSRNGVIGVSQMTWQLVQES